MKFSFVLLAAFISVCACACMGAVPPQCMEKWAGCAPVNNTGDGTGTKVALSGVVYNNVDAMNFFAVNRGAWPFLRNYEFALGVIFNLGTENATIRSYDPVVAAHMTFEYFCDLTETDIINAQYLFSAFEWEPVEISFAGVVCNAEPGEDYVSLDILLDPGSQDKMFAVVRRFEQFLRGRGFPVAQPRHFPFHVTLAQVTMDYPIEEAITQLNNQFEGEWTQNPVVFDWFWTPPFSVSLAKQN